MVCTSSDDESDYEDEGAEHSGPQMVIANKNDKGRFSQSPLKQENVGLISQMSREEKERKKADQKLNSAEKILKKSQKANPNLPRSLVLVNLQVRLEAVLLQIKN